MRASESAEPRRDPVEAGGPGAGHRDRLLAAAVECLRERGYARTTARDLVAASDTNLASIGYHFGSKESLLNEAIAQGFAAWTAEVERAAFGPGEAGSVELLQRSLEAVIDRFEELRPFLVAFVEAFPQAVRSPELRDRMAAAYDEVREAGAAMVRRGLAADGVELAAADAEAIASLLIAACDGLILQWLIDPERVPSAERVIGAGTRLAVAALAASVEAGPGGPGTALKPAAGRRSGGGPRAPGR